MAIYNRAQLQPNNKRKLPAQEDTQNQLANQLAQKQLAQQQLAQQQQKPAMGTQADLRQQMLPVVNQANTRPQQQGRKPVDTSAIQQQDVVATNQQATRPAAVDRSQLQRQDNLIVTDKQATDEALRRVMQASPQQPPPPQQTQTTTGPSPLSQAATTTMAAADKPVIQRQAAIPPPTLPQSRITTMAAADKPVDRSQLQRQDNLIVTDQQATQEALRRVMQTSPQQPPPPPPVVRQTQIAQPATPRIDTTDLLEEEMTDSDLISSIQVSTPGEGTDGGLQEREETTLLRPAAPPTIATGGGRPPGTLADLAREEEITSFLTGKRRPDPTTQELTEAAIRDLLTGAGLDTESEKAARREQAQADEARAIQALRARTGLGGMGLTGAAGALESQIRREATRTRELTEAELDRAAREEALRRTQLGISAGQAEREMAIREQVYGMEMDLYEMETDRDQNGDGLINGVPVGGPIGDGKLENNPDYEEESVAPEVREGQRGYYTEEQATTMLKDQYGITLDSLDFGHPIFDLLSPLNTKIFTYEDEYGRVIEVFSRAPDHDTYFKKMTLA